MDFNDAPEEADFRAEARTWLEKTLGAANAKTLVRIDGPDGLKAAKAYQAKKAAAAGNQKLVNKLLAQISSL